MHLRDRFIIHDPPGLDATLATAAQENGAWALLDATRHGERAKLDTLDADRVILRVPLDAQPTPNIGIAVLAPWRIEPEHVPGLEDAIQAWKHQGTPAAVEVRTKEEARRAVDAGADMLVARGAEGPGRASERSNLVLLPALATFDVPLIAWGGAGPNATGALFVHADMVVLDAQLYLLNEAGLSQAWKRSLRAFDGSDIKALGSTLGEPFHVHARIADEHVHEAWEREQASEAGPSTRREELSALLDDQQAGFDQDPGDGFFPLGHDAAHASFFEEHETLDEALSFLESRIQDQLDQFALTEGSSLAREHGTRYPIVQGAMANVSEVPAFAKAVADEGALPFLAFAALREAWAKEALEGTLDALDEDQPFGCGIIGLDVNAKKRDAHIRLLKEHQPPYALIAAGTAEQALHLENEGIDTYLHTPSRGIVRQALDMGLERIVVEGNECGGHIGKLPSLVLWDQALQEVHQHGDDTMVLLAGGIGDDATSAMAGTLASASTARVGALMGTAYLATQEIVDTGAIPDSYQDVVLAAKDTDVTGATTGIRSRSAPTPFTKRISDYEQTLLKQGVPLDERQEKVERKNLGSTRLAARRLKRDDEGDYHTVPVSEQLTEGNFLMGQGAELIEERITIKDLHENVTATAKGVQTSARERLSTPFTPPTVSDATFEIQEGAVAIVGLGCVMPDADDVGTFWENLMQGHVSIRELPEGRWPVPKESHYDPDGEEGTYTLLGAFIEETNFDSIDYRIPPAVAEQMDPGQKWAVKATEQALQDAGLDTVEDRDRWSVILGNAQGGETRNWSDRRIALRETRAQLERDGAPQDVLDRVEAMKDDYKPITEDTMPGELSNVIASRVCHVFDIGGPARTVDTACASSLAAAEEAVRQLRDGDVDVAITGGVDRSMHPAAYTKFSAIGALSKEGSFPFDERASGFVMGEGCGILVLKRLEDAIEDGNTVYAVIEGVGSSSDGSGKGITAPNPEGQERAMQRAWDDAGTDPGTLGFIEAHGTGTPVGDPTEAQTLDAMIREHANGPVALGSVKANIGHLKSAAGAAGLLKAALALHHKRVPPTPVSTPTPHIDWDASPLEVAMEPVDLPSGTVRAGVSAFGFGGTNSHLVLANAPTPNAPKRERAKAPFSLVSGDDIESMQEALATPREAWTFNEDDALRVAVQPHADQADAEKLLNGELPPGLALRKGIAVAMGEQGQLGLVFPGQGSQYPGMVLDLADEHPAAQDVLDEADQILAPLLGKPLTHFLELDDEDALTPTEICQPAVLTCDIAILRVLEEHGVEPDVVAGHSLGEYAALVAAGALSFEDALMAVSARGEEMKDVAEKHVDDPGGLIAVRAGPDTCEDLIDGLEAWPANLNGPEQTVLAGTTSAIDTIKQRANDADIKSKKLPVSAAFHSPIVAPATEPLRKTLERIPVDPPQIPVISNATAEPYPEDPDAIRDLLAKQVKSPVRWMETMQRFDDMGVKLVVETGPKPILTGLARENLPETMSVPTAYPREGAKETLDIALLALAAHGHLHLPDEDTPTAKVQPEPEASKTTVTGPRTHQDHDATAEPNHAGAKPRVVVSGVSLGLPSPDLDEDAFSEHAKNALLTGENRIARVTDQERDAMANMGVTRLVKDDEKGPHLVDIDDPNEVVHLVGRLPTLDLAAYDADEDWLKNADPTSRFGIAAALEALTDAKIPLVPNTREASTGTTLTSGWVLPKPLQGETGVILASAFPGYANLVRILNEHAPNRDHAPRSDAGQDRLTGFLADLIPRIEDEEVRKTALDLLLQHGQRDPPPQASLGNEDAKTSTNGAPHEEENAFPRDFLFQALGMGHAQIAQLINAKGPNLHVNAACASTTSAIALAQDWIQQGRCERVIVVGADVGGDPSLLPLIGSGFLAAGAATTSKHVDEAALPFDERRHGMLVGSGAVGLVLETHEAANDRGITPLAELVHAHTANSAYHGARLDPEHVKHELDKAIGHATKRLDTTRSEIAKDLVFVSHEPATPARGGSAEAEVRALRHALDEAAPDVLVTNTKGLTGHAMGAGIEDAIAVELLRARQAPPVANLKHVDPAFTDLTFSQGEPTDRSLSLRFAAGFGSQVAIAMFKRTHDAPGTLDEATHNAWLARTIGEGTTTRMEDRCLRATPQPEAAPTATNPQPAKQTVPATPTSRPQTKPAGTRSDANGQERASPDEADREPAPVQGLTLDEVQALLTELVSKKTGYPEDVIEPEMDLEADLGVDTVKQAEVVSQARTRLDIPPIEGLSLGDVPTLRQASKLLHQHATGQEAPTEDDTEQAPPKPSSDPAPPKRDDAMDQPPTDELTIDDVEALLTELASKKTGYPEDVIEPQMDLEADLGIDTVKQAEILSQARTRLEIPPIEGLSLGDVPTLRQASTLLHQHATGQPQTGQADDEPTQDKDEPGAPREVRVLNVTTAPAPATQPLPQGTRTKTMGEPDEALDDALEATGATLVDDADQADLILLNLQTVDPDPDGLTALLERLQGIPQGTRIVLLASQQGANTGLPALAGTLTQEGWPTRAIRVAPKTPRERIATETLQDTTANILLSPHERRTSALAPTGQPAPVELSTDAVVLAPGGLGAAVLPCLERLAEEQDVRLAIAGRSPIEDPTLDPDDEDDIAHLRETLLDEARERDAPLRPAEIEEDVQRRVKLARRAKAYQRLAKTTKVRYDQVDATDPDQLAAWVDDVTRAWETPRLIVHGAGVDDSRGFQQKTRDTMHTVLDVKLTPVETLTRSLPEAHHVAFGSIAGVAGNPGQADYALANGTLQALLDPVDGTVLHWTAWDAAGGMADDETIRTVLEERDVAFLDPEQGASLFMDWAGTRGTFAVGNMPPDSGLMVTKDGAILALTGEEAWLNDHKVGGRRLLPGVRHLEAMAEAWRGNGERVDGFHKVRFEHPVWVNEATHVKVEIEEGQARTVRDDRVHARAGLGAGSGGKHVPWEGMEGEALSRDDIYEALFHGPTFQVLERVVTSAGRAEAVADLGVGGGASWLLALEAGMQAAGIGAGDEVALPVGVERVVRGVDPVGSKARVACRLVGEDLGGSTWDVTVRGEGDALVLHAEGVRLQRADALSGMMDAVVGLGAETGVTVKAVSVPVHDPRDPASKREAEHEAGKDAARRALEESHGGKAAVSYSEEGQPLVEEGAVSISHAEGFAIAASDADVTALGVDLERVEARDEAWLKDAFSKEEEAWIRDHAWGVDAAATLGWTIKEAASKALGTGLREPLGAFEVRMGEASARVSTPGGVFVARWARAGEGVVALAWPEGALDA